MKYIIKEINEDPMLSVIEKSGHVITFTALEVKQDLLQWEKLLTQLQGKYELDKAKMANIEEHHPFVKDLSDQDQLTVHMYTEAKASVSQIGPKIEEIKKTLEEYQVEIADIDAQTGIYTKIDSQDTETKAINEELASEDSDIEAPEGPQGVETTQDSAQDGVQVEPTNEKTDSSTN